MIRIRNLGCSLAIFTIGAMQPSLVRWADGQRIVVAEADADELTRLALVGPA